MARREQTFGASHQAGRAGAVKPSGIVCNLKGNFKLIHANERRNKISRLPNNSGTRQA